MIAPEHPAKFSARVVARIATMLDEDIALHPGALIVDPFAGVGGVHALGAGRWRTTGVELEPEWANVHPDTIIGDALHLPFEDSTVDAVVTSPCYGNRMADHHEARDWCPDCDGSGRESSTERWVELHAPDVGPLTDEPCATCDGHGKSRRNTYRHLLGRQLTDGSSAVMQWGPAYRDFHERAWRECRRVLKPNAWMIVNVSNHIRGGEEQRVVEFHLNALLVRGFRLHSAARVSTPRNGFGANGDLRVDGESVLVLRAPEVGR